VVAIDEPLGIDAQLRVEGLESGQAIKRPEAGPVVLRARIQAPSRLVVVHIHDRLGLLDVGLEHACEAVPQAELEPSVEQQCRPDGDRDRAGHQEGIEDDASQAHGEL